jgi:hypothetical protein
MLGFYSQSDMRHNWASTAVSSTRRPHFTPRKFLGTYFCEAEWATRLLNVDKKVFLKFPRTLSGIEPGISRLVAQCLNQLGTTHPAQPCCRNQSVQCQSKISLRLIETDCFYRVHRSPPIIRLGPYKSSPRQTILFEIHCILSTQLLLWLSPKGYISFSFHHQSPACNFPPPCLLHAPPIYSLWLSKTDYSDEQCDCRH